MSTTQVPAVRHPHGREVARWAVRSRRPHGLLTGRPVQLVGHDRYQAIDTYVSFHVWRGSGGHTERMTGLCVRSLLVEHPACGIPSRPWNLHHMVQGRHPCHPWHDDRQAEANHSGSLTNCRFHTERPNLLSPRVLPLRDIDVNSIEAATLDTCLGDAEEHAQRSVNIRLYLTIRPVEEASEVVMESLSIDFASHFDFVDLQ